MRTPYKALTLDDVKQGDLVLVPLEKTGITVDRVYGWAGARVDKSFTISITGGNTISSAYVVLLKKNGDVFLGKGLYEQLMKKLEEGKKSS
jgi:hypothetical protein